MIVVDASVAIDLVMGAHLPDAIHEAVAADQFEFNAPEVLDREVCNAIRGLERGGDLTARSAAEALLRFPGLEIN